MKSNVVCHRQLPYILAFVVKKDHYNDLGTSWNILWLTGQKSFILVKKPNHLSTYFALATHSDDRLSSNKHFEYP